MIFKNLKIAINEQQPLDEVVRELERLGYICDHRVNSGTVRFVFCFDDGDVISSFQDHDGQYELTTLAELKEM